MTDEFAVRLHDIVRMHLRGPSDVRPAQGPLPGDVSLVSLGLDSVSAVNLVLDLEDTFGIEFGDQMLTDATFQTLQTLTSTVRRMVASSGPVGV